jgi:hypothetical protein
MTSLTGEKLHVDQCLAAAQMVQRQLKLSFNAFRLVADAESACYHFLVEPAGGQAGTLNIPAISRAIDGELGAQNLEYAKKRRAGQLDPPDVVVMRSGWSDAVCRNAFAAGRRDIQYKWKHLAESPVIEDLHYASAAFAARRCEALAS